jgi:hypothetical protein
MHCRLLAILAVLSFAFGGGGCASKSNKDYEDVLMPLQTGSVIQRHVQVKADHQTKPQAETKKKKKPAEPKPEPEPDAEAETPAKPRPTPTPTEESTPPTERFR